MLISELINTAYRKIGVVGHGQAATAEESAAGVEAFNLMLSALFLDGINLYTSLTDPTALTEFPEYAATDDVPAPPAFREGLAYLLATRLAPEFALPGFNEEMFKVKMRAALLPDCTATFPSGLVYAPSYPRDVF